MIKVRSGWMTTVGTTSGNERGHEGPLAEFVALRQEIERRSTMMHNLFALQLTAAAVIFSFALSRSGRSAFLLIIPVSTFMLCARYVDQVYGVRNAGQYIRSVLDSRVPGGLGWEKWIREEGNQSKVAQFSQLRRLTALMVTFPAIAAGALAWSAPGVFWFAHRLAADERSALIVTWILGLAATASSTRMIWCAVRLTRPKTGDS